MFQGLSRKQLLEAGLDEQAATQLIKQLEMHLKDCHHPEQAWSIISKKILSNPYPFNIHTLLFSTIYPKWKDHPESAPAWIPEQELISSAHITKFMHELNIHDVKAFHQWSVSHYQDFWSRMIDKLKIKFTHKANQICDLSAGVESPSWFPGAMLNIVDSCFTAPAAAIAIVYDDNKTIRKITYGELDELVNRIANSLIKKGFVAGDAIGIAMPMNHFAVAIYLGIIKMGGVVVSIADSFSSEEMATRLRITKAKAVFTQDVSIWAKKQIPLYEKVCAANAKQIIVLTFDDHLSLRKEDCTWRDFLVADKTFSAIPCDPMTACNILFSSGTTADPKAIVWNHTTAIKAASDAYLHHNMQSNDVILWPTNLGWMMGPWLIYATLINQASIALYTEAPKDKDFGEFIQNAKVTILGVVPTAVAAWRQSRCMENLDLSAIKVFTSTGECSNPDDMLYLMSLAGYKPVIEYCGGTEIGGAYMSSTVIEKNCPSLFTTAAMGMNLMILDEQGHPATDGAVAIIPPSIGLSTKLLNADHHEVYFADMPKSLDGKILRSHGDQVKQFSNGYYSILGRIDDTMNLGGIKISSAEIERAVAGLPDIIEVAAIAIPPPDNGPSLLVIYATATGELDKSIVMKEMQKKINSHLNPLFKIHDVVFTKDLPKTASNKIMRRVLRKKYMEQ